MITKNSIVATVYEQHPQAAAIFKRFGFHALANPMLRKTIGRVTTIERGCKMHGVDPEEFVEALNQAIASKDTKEPPQEEGPYEAVEVSEGDLPLVDSVRQAKIAALVDQYPQVISVFQKYFGGGCFSCPSFGMEDVDFACSMHGTDPNQFALECLEVIKKGCDCC